MLLKSAIRIVSSLNSARSNLWIPLPPKLSAFLQIFFCQFCCFPLFCLVQEFWKMIKKICKMLHSIVSIETTTRDVWWFCCKEAEEISANPKVIFNFINFLSTLILLTISTLFLQNLSLTSIIQSLHLWRVWLLRS